MLQQTQVATVIPYWHRWMARFPTVESLAVADIEDVLAVWQGLGYYRRCRMLEQGAKFAKEKGIPTTVEEWLRVPGVGRYTAGAIASIAQGIPAPLVDGNVERVYARLNSDPASGPRLNKNSWLWATEVLDKERPGDWNQALMELGATVCTPVNPSCDRCPLSESCLAYTSGDPEQFPTPKVRKTVVELRHELWIPRFQELFGVEQIPEGEWWAGMWQFPRDTNGERQPPAGDSRYLGTLRHTVTRHRISLRVSEVACRAKYDGLRWLSKEEMAKVALPAPQRKALALLSGPQATMDL